MRGGTVAWAVVVTALATAANRAHGVAYLGQGATLLPYWHRAYIVGVVFLAPILAALLRTRCVRAGASLLVVSTAGASAFGAAHHFFVPGPDGAFALPAGCWRLPFRIFAALVALTSGAGFVVGVLRGVSFPSGGAGSARAGSRPGPRRGPW